MHTQKDSPCKWEAHMPPPPITLPNGTVILRTYTTPEGGAIMAVPANGGEMTSVEWEALCEGIRVGKSFLALKEMKDGR